MNPIQIVVVLRQDSNGETVAVYTFRSASLGKSQTAVSKAALGLRAIAAAKDEAFKELIESDGWELDAKDTIAMLNDVSVVKWDVFHTVIS